MMFLQTQHCSAQRNDARVLPRPRITGSGRVLESTGELYASLMQRGDLVRYPFGVLPALVNIDLQQAHTAVGSFATAYTPEANPHRVNALAEAARRSGAPAIWSYVAY